MPVFKLAGEREQLALLASRHLKSVASAADLLTISRQAVEKAAGKPKGRLLLWIFDGERSDRLIDFGPKSREPDPNAWRSQERSLESIVLDSVQDGATDETTRVDHEALLLLHLLASGISAVAAGDRKGEPVRVPYPASLQKALDRLTLRCLLAKRSPPAGVPDLLAWCRRPIRSWGLACWDGIVAEGDSLLDGRFPTALCEEWAIDASDVEGEVLERSLLLDVLRVCERAHDESAYVAFRELLIRRPVLTSLELQQSALRVELLRLTDQLNRAYEPAPSTWAVNGSFVCCKNCGNILAPGRDTILRCTDDRCATEISGGAGRRITVAEEPMVLKAPLRAFIAAPGRAEIRLAERVERLGIKVALWPALDAYDLQLMFEDGTTWAVDVKDWASPFALARHLGQRTFPERPSWDRAYFVFPEYRLRLRPDYVRAFLRFSPAVRSSARLAALSENAFVAAVQAQARASSRKSRRA